MNTTASPEGIDDLNYMFNDSVNGTTNGVQFETPMYFLITSTVFFLLVFIVGLVGNIYIIALVCGRRHIRTKMSLLFMNLSITDLLVLIVSMPLSAMGVYTKAVWYFGDAACRFSYFLDSAVILASALTILVIGVDRYFAICKSTTDNAWKRLSVAWKIIGIWTLASLSSVPCAFIVNLQGGIYNEGTTSETCYLILDRKWKFAYFISMLVVLFFLIFLVLLFLIQRMSSFLLPASNLFEGQIQAKRIRERKTVVFMLFLVVICFFACVLPVRLLMISFVLDEGKTITRLGIEAFANLNISLRMLMYLNSALNPVIYNLSTNIRKVTVSLLRKWCILCKKQQRYGVDNQEAEMNHRNPDIPARQREFNLVQISIIPYNKQ